MEAPTILLAAALVAAPATLAGSHAMDDAREYGHCTAYENSEIGRENGNASQAEPFQAIEENASAENASVTAYCEDVEHPSEHASAANEHHPREAGPPDKHPPNDARPDGDDEPGHQGSGDEHRPGEDERGPP